MHVRLNLQKEPRIHYFRTKERYVEGMGKSYLPAVEESSYGLRNRLGIPDERIITLANCVFMCQTLIDFIGETMPRETFDAPRNNGPGR